MGGVVLKHHLAKDEIHWLICTEMKTEVGYSEGQIKTQKETINQVSKEYGFKKIHQLDFCTTKLDTVPLRDVIGEISKVFMMIKPEIVYIPFENDVHTDHKIINEATLTCCKSFRYPFIEKIMCYETLSETDHDLHTEIRAFKPNVYVSIDNALLDKKIEIMNLYKNEMSDHPFPRSEKSIRALAVLRGAQSHCNNAEAFVLVKEIFK